MSRRWDDEQRIGDHDAWAAGPADAPASEELEHETALAASLDRSRRDLSPDPHASARMRARLFETLAREGVGNTAAEQPGSTRPVESPFGRRHVEPPDPTAPIGPPISDDLPHEAATTRRTAGEHLPETDDPGSRPRRRPRHVLPADHPDHPERTTAAAGAAGDRNGPGRDGDERPAPRMLDRRRPSVRKRFGIVVGGFAALAVVAGVTSTMSRDALPGDTMYGVKRANESAGGLFTMGDQAEAARQLDIARSRVDEIENLMARNSSPSPDAIAGSLDDFDRATGNGSRMMLSGNDSDGADPARLADLRTWAQTQSQRLGALQGRMPAADRPEAAESAQLLDRVLARAEAMRATSCSTDGGAVDDLGPIPGRCGSSGTDQRAKASSTGSPAAESSEQATGTSAAGSTTPSSESATGQSSAESATPSPSNTPEQSAASSSSSSTSPSPSTSSSAPSSTTEAPSTGTTDSGRDSAQDSEREPEKTTGSAPKLPLLGGGGVPAGGAGTPAPSTQKQTGPLPPVQVPPLLPGLGPVKLGG
ncbi:DUF5667 domain-containing protein [Pseudonocardia phyllosphaerae]|uniref:DUF5667 domain-containing protein n=1 Tax=Pseudonocardia phyllosphaerae TaxID=3390502 RepID=UPI0039782B68